LVVLPASTWAQSIHIALHETSATTTAMAAATAPLTQGTRVRTDLAARNLLSAGGP
jgi:hypothetical protein